MCGRSCGRIARRNGALNNAAMKAVRKFLAIAMVLYAPASLALIAYLVSNTHAGYVLGVKIGLIDNAGITEFQKNTVAHHMRLDRNLTDGRLVFLGDSHILGLDTMQVAPDGVNFGIGGETTAGLLARVGRYKSVRQARGVVIGIGFNDFGRHESGQTVDNVRRILARISVPVVLCGILPVAPGGAENPAAAKLNAAIASINSDLRSICTKDCIFADPDPIFAGMADPAPYYESDGVHLSREGYGAWTKLISHYVATL
jgi:lysophospholipase L1-like esterase